MGLDAWGSTSDRFIRIVMRRRSGGSVSNRSRWLSRVSRVSRSSGSSFVRFDLVVRSDLVARRDGFRLGLGRRRVLGGRLGRNGDRRHALGKIDAEWCSTAGGGFGYEHVLSVLFFAKVSSFGLEDLQKTHRSELSPVSSSASSSSACLSAAVVLATGLAVAERGPTSDGSGCRSSDPPTAPTASARRRLVG